MNFVFLSPHFPPNYYQFAVALKDHGVNVLGLADENYDSLRPELKSALTEYYRVHDMHNYEELVRALGHFTHRYGKLNRLDSHNEYWLETEARLRTDFNTPASTPIRSSRSSPTNPYWEDTDNPIIDTNSTPPTTNYPLVTNFIIAYYVPSEHTGSVAVGSLRLVPDAEILPTGLTLRATYVPRYIRQFRLHYRPNWPCTPVIESANSGEALQNWSITQTNDGAGGYWLRLSSPYTQSVTNSLPFAWFGKLLTFKFRDVINPSNAFSLFEIDNTIYTNTGKQIFVLQDTNSFITNYVVLPYGTPVPWLIANGFTNNFDAAELSDSDGDGCSRGRNTRPTRIRGIRRHDSGSRP